MAGDVLVFDNQIGALSFDSAGLRILQVYWTKGGALGTADPFDGSERIDRALPVANSWRFPRGDFAFSRDGRRLAAPTRRDPTVVGVWDVALGRLIVRLQGSEGAVTAVAFGPDGRSLASAAPGGPERRPIVALWNLDSGRAIQTLQAGPGPVQAVAFSDDGRKVAAGGGTRPDSPGWVTVWDAETGTVRKTRDRVSGVVKSLSFHPDGSRIAVAGYGEQGAVHLWDLAADTWISHPGPNAVSCVAFTPDGKRLAALGYDGHVHLADARTGDEVLVLHTSGRPLAAAATRPGWLLAPTAPRSSPMQLTMS